MAEHVGYKDLVYICRSLHTRFPGTLCTSLLRELKASEPSDVCDLRDGRRFPPLLLPKTSRSWPFVESWLLIADRVVLLSLMELWNWGLGAKQRKFWNQLLAILWKFPGPRLLWRTPEDFSNSSLDLLATVQQFSLRRCWKLPRAKCSFYANGRRSWTDPWPPCHICKGNSEETSVVKVLHSVIFSAETLIISVLQYLAANIKYFPAHKAFIVGRKTYICPWVCLVNVVVRYDCIWVVWVIRLLKFMENSFVAEMRANDACGSRACAFSACVDCPFSVLLTLLSVLQTSVLQTSLRAQHATSCSGLLPTATTI